MTTINITTKAAETFYQKNKIEFTTNTDCIVYDETFEMNAKSLASVILSNVRALDVADDIEPFEFICNGQSIIAEFDFINYKIIL